MDGCGEYAAALAAFVLAHVLPTRPRVRRRLTAVAGERRYLALYSLVSLGNYLRERLEAAADDRSE